MGTKFIEVSGSAIEYHLEDIAKLRIEIFKEFPYLYDGNIDYEKQYLETYVSSNKSLVILAYIENKLVGVSTCIAMNDSDDYFRCVFSKEGFNINKSFYFGESIVLKEFRGNKIGFEFFKKREQFARRIYPNIELIAFCSVDRPNNHGLRPKSYKSLNQFWSRLGYSIYRSAKVNYSWKDIDNESESLKQMSVWIKKVI